MSSTTTLVEVANQVQKYWSPLWMKQLRESLLLGGLVNKQYDGEIKKGGDTVYVSQLNAPTGQTLTIGTDADSFSSEAASLSRVAIQANKRFLASYEFEDVVDLQSQLAQENPEVMNALMYAVNKQINDYLYGLVSASTSSPDHDIASVSDFNASQLAACRILAGQAKWSQEPGWYGLLDPQYHMDIINATTLASVDYGAADSPTISGKIVLPRMGFQLVEDNSRSADHGLLFHPDFMHFVMQKAPTIKISDLHSQKRFGVVMSIDVIGGAAMGIDGSKKCIKVYNSAW